MHKFILAALMSLVVQVSVHAEVYNSSQRPRNTSQGNENLKYENRVDYQRDQRNVNRDYQNNYNYPSNSSDNERNYQNQNRNEYRGKDNVYGANENTERYPQDTYSTFQDRVLNNKIRNTISDGYFWDSYKDVTVNTNNGVVTLTGSVKNNDERQKIINELKKVYGIKSIKSELVVKK